MFTGDPGKPTHKITLAKTSKPNGYMRQHNDGNQPGPIGLAQPTRGLPTPFPVFRAGGQGSLFTTCSGRGRKKERKKGRKIGRKKGRKRRKDRKRKEERRKGKNKEERRGKKEERRKKKEERRKKEEERSKE